METNITDTSSSHVSEIKEKQNFINLLTQYTNKKGGTAYCGYRYISDTHIGKYTTVWKMRVTEKRKLEFEFVEQTSWKNSVSRTFSLLSDETDLSLLKNVAYYLRGWPNVYIQSYESVIDSMSLFYKCYTEYLNSEKKAISIYDERLSNFQKILYERYGTIVQNQTILQQTKANLYSLICNLEKELQQSRSRMGLDWSKTMN